MKFTPTFFKEANNTISKIEKKKIESIAKMLKKLRSNKGRLFKFVVFNNSGGSEDVRLVPISDTFNILS